MNKLILPLSILVLLFSACSKDDEQQQVSQEFKSINEITNIEATEILRHNVLEEYGGVFKLLKMYHTEVRIEDFPCDSELNVFLMDENPLKYTLSSEVEIKSDCDSGWGVYNNRFYRGQHALGTQTTTSEIFDLEMRIEDMQTVAGNFEEQVYTYSHFVNREILITSGVSPELDPTAELDMFFPSCQYDNENIALTSATIATFKLEIKTNEGEPVPSSKKNFEGTLELIDNKWSAIFDDGTIIQL